MREGLHHFENTTDLDGNPAGGFVNGNGIRIRWQDGPLGCKDDRVPANGAFVEDVLEAVQQRIEHYNDGKFRCRENSIAITKIEEALMWLDARTRRREREGVEGTHEV